MNALNRLAGVIIAVGVVMALAEAEWKITVAVLAAGFFSLFTASVAVGQQANDQYVAAVLSCRRLGESASRSLHSPAFGLVFLTLFLSLAGLSVYLDRPAVFFAALSVLTVAGLRLSARADQRRNGVWMTFAAEHQLEFHHGNVLDHLDNPRLEGRLSGRFVRLSVVDVKGGHRKRSRRFLSAEIGTLTGPATFCVDDLKPTTAIQTPQAVQQLFAWRELSAHIHALQPSRISLCDEVLSLHAPRIPQCRMELEFLIDILQQAAAVVERAVAQH